MLSYRVPLGLAALVVAPLAFFWGWDLLRIGYPESSVPWTLADISDDGRTLAISYGGLTCQSLDRIEKSETERSVSILVVLDRPPYDSCDGDDGLESLRSDVELLQPLAGRDLVDRHTGTAPVVNERAVTWTFLELASSGRAVTISYLGSSCDELNRVRRRDTREAVEIRVEVALSLEGGCVSDVPRQRVVMLGSPLGDRVLLDPRTAEPPPGFPDSG
jgi:hypothetical protein